MSEPVVTVVDYGMGNLYSVARALEQCGARPRMAQRASDLAHADRVVLPGVGAFGDGMAELGRRGFVAPLAEIAAKGYPFLGICLGMQMLMDQSEEFGPVAGLGLIPGKVGLVPRADVAGRPQRVPHIGWSPLLPPEGGTADRWRGTVLESFEPGVEVYFVHSYAAVPADPADRLADCDYGGHRLCAAVARGNVQGTQFHPEKSGERGLSIIRRFLAL